MNGAKLTQDQVLAIRNEPPAYGSGRRLAEQYGLHEITVHNIRKGKTWKHLDTTIDR